MMEKEFVPYELAVKLKELGFNEPCIAYYTGRGIVYDVYTVSNFSGRNVLGGKAIATPLYQQVFDWFREKYKLNKTITPDCFNIGLWEFKIDSIDKSMVLDKIYDSPYWVREGTFTTYEEARQACLEKLIEIIENK